MNRRSRSGCFDCRRAKVKCDEQRPFCGTCLRRKKQCHGYPAKQPPQPSIRWTLAHNSSEGPPKKKQRSSCFSPGFACIEIQLDDKREHRFDYVGSHSTRRASLSEESGFQAMASRHDEVLWTSNRPVDTEETEFVNSVRGAPKVARSDVSLHLARSLPRSLSPFFNSSIAPEIAHGISIYFTRHPVELVIGSEPIFIHEMNTHVLGVLQSGPEVVGDSLSAIGQTYLHNQGAQSSLTIALNSRVKTLMRIRKGDGLSIEQATSMILGLASMELIDTGYRPSESSFHVLHSAAAAMINCFLATRLTLSPTAKYMIRALAREDMIMALVHQKRSLIPTSVWLDEECRSGADRFMGSTMTLMPLLEELCILAEDFRCFNERNASVSVHTPPAEDCSPIEEDLPAFSLLKSRADSLHTRIATWTPPLIPAFSGLSSRKFLLHASMYRLGALLHLHRLVHPHGYSSEHEEHALVLAYDIFAHLSTDPRDKRLALFPIFLATCEFEIHEDRNMALQEFDKIYGSRKTFSTLVTKKFVAERVWKARDEGREWGWMECAKRWKGECVPI